MSARRTRNGNNVATQQELAQDMPEAAVVLETAPVDDEQELSEAIYGETPFIDDVKARDGMTQMWVRVLLNNEPDVRNISKVARQGWRPRALDTVPKGFSPPTVRHPQIGNVIGVGDLVLYEIPTKRHNLIKASYRTRLNEQLRAVNNQVERATDGQLEVLVNKSTATSRKPSFGSG